MVVDTEFEDLDGADGDFSGGAVTMADVSVRLFLEEWHDPPIFDGAVVVDALHSGHVQWVDEFVFTDDTVTNQFGLRLALL